LRPSCRQSRA
jgi:transposase